MLEHLDVMDQELVYFQTYLQLNYILMLMPSVVYQLIIRYYITILWGQVSVNDREKCVELWMLSGAHIEAA